MFNLVLLMGFQLLLIRSLRVTLLNWLNLLLLLLHIWLFYLIILRQQYRRFLKCLMLLVLLICIHYFSLPLFLAFVLCLLLLNLNLRFVKIHLSPKVDQWVISLESNLLSPFLLDYLFELP
jgi:hypothetical protein